MKKSPPKIRLPGKFAPQARLLLWYFPATLLVLWLWQDYFSQFAARTIPYSQFKAHLERREVVEAAVAPVIYEITLPAQGSWEAFRDATFPLLVRYLRAQGVDPENPVLLVVALFDGDRCYLLEGRDFFNAQRELEGLNDSALHSRVLRWLSEPIPSTLPT